MHDEFIEGCIKEEERRRAEEERESFVLDVGQANELKHAFARNRWTNEQIKLLTQGARLAKVLDFFLDLLAMEERERFKNLHQYEIQGKEPEADEYKEYRFWRASDEAARRFMERRYGWDSFCLVRINSDGTRTPLKKS